MSPGKRWKCDMTSVCDKFTGLGCGSVTRVTYGFSAEIIKTEFYLIMAIWSIICDLSCKRDHFW